MNSIGRRMRIFANIKNPFDYVDQVSKVALGDQSSADSKKFEKIVNCLLDTSQNSNIAK